MIFISVVIAVIALILMLGIMIMIHECGHFFAAKLFGVKVLEFSLGMGPRLFKIQGKETLYSIKLFPIGGSVQMEGEEQYSDDKRSFHQAKVWKRLIIVSAGAFMNLVLGFITMIVIVSVFFNLVPTTEVARFETMTIQGVETPPMSNTEGGLQEHDEILKVNGKSVWTKADISYILGLCQDESVDITVKRNGETVELKDVRFPQVNANGQIGLLMDFNVYGESKNPVNVITHSFKETVGMVKLVYRSLGEIITGNIPVSNLSGIVGVGDVIADGVENSQSFGDMMYMLLMYLAMISVNLGIFNLLPFPALDGGHVVFLAYEGIFRRPVPEKVYMALNMIGFGLLILLMILVTFKDVFTIFFR